jgi:hypothetical protein
MMMTKMRSKSDIAKTEAWLDQLEPSAHPSRDATHSRRIIRACHELERADAGLHQVVAEARSAGESWSVIGLALGTTRQAAQQRFGQGT